MNKIIRRLICRHSYMWSERRKQDVCYHCGRVMQASQSAVPAPIVNRKPVNPSVMSGNGLV